MVGSKDFKRRRTGKIDRVVHMEILRSLAWITVMGAGRQLPDSISMCRAGGAG